MVKVSNEEMEILYCLDSVVKKARKTTRSVQSSTGRSTTYSDPICFCKKTEGSSCTYTYFGPRVFQDLNTTPPIQKAELTVIIKRHEFNSIGGIDVAKERLIAALNKSVSEERLGPFELKDVPKPNNGFSGFQISVKGPSPVSITAYFLTEGLSISDHAKMQTYNIERLYMCMTTQKKAQLSHEGEIIPIDKVANLYTTMNPNKLFLERPAEALKAIWLSNLLEIDLSDSLRDWLQHHGSGIIAKINPNHSEVKLQFLRLAQLSNWTSAFMSIISFKLFYVDPRNNIRQSFAKKYLQKLSNLMKESDDDEISLVEPEEYDLVQFKGRQEIYHLICLAFCILENLIKYQDYMPYFKDLLATLLEPESAKIVIDCILGHREDTYLRRLSCKLLEWNLEMLLSQWDLPGSLTRPEDLDDISLYIDPRNDTVLNANLSVNESFVSDTSNALLGLMGSRSMSLANKSGYSQVLL